MRTVRQIGIGWGLVVAFFFALNQSVVSEEKQADKPWSMRVRYNLQQPLPFRYSDSVGITARVLDWDGDGLLDVTAHNLEPTAFYVYRNIGTKTRPLYKYDTKERKVYTIEQIWGVYGYDRAEKRQHYYAYDIADWNNDGKWDVVPGVILHLNRGTNAAPNYENTGPFMIGGKPYPYLNKYTGTRQADLDGDGLKDLFVFGSFAPAGMYATEGIAKAKAEVNKPGYDPERSTWVRPRLHFCKNVGTNEQPRFDSIQDMLFGGVKIDEYVLTMPYPAFADWDNDGDLDLICGDWARNIYFFRNVGSRTSPQFEPDKLKLAQGFQRLQPGHVPAVAKKVTLPVAKVPTRIEQNISIELPEFNPCPSVLDWDADGDLDIVVSTNNSWLYLLENIGNREQPVLAKYKNVEMPLELTSQATLGLDNYNIPQVVDWDADGDVDIIMGGEQGYVYFYENVGGKGKHRRFRKPQRLQTVNGSPIWMADIADGYFDGLWHPGIAVCSANYYAYPEPTVIDMDSDGDLDMILGDQSLHLNYVENIGSRAKPALKPPRPLKLDDQLYSGGWRSRPGAIDFDGDGVVEVVHLQLNGVYYMYKVAKRGDELYLTAAKKLLDEKGEPFKTPASAERGGLGERQQISIVDWDGDSDYDLIVGWLAGRVIFCENTGSNKAPKFRTEFLTSQGETFRVDFTAGCSAGVWVYDWDGDGMLDLLGGGDCGWLFAYDGHLFDQH